jgi:hypothetical protein
MRVDYAECRIWAKGGMLRRVVVRAGARRSAGAAADAYEPAFEAGFALSCQSVKEE